MRNFKTAMSQALQRIQKKRGGAEEMQMYWTIVLSKKAFILYHKVAHFYDTQLHSIILSLRSFTLATP
jgi:hypothetical protein